MKELEVYLHELTTNDHFSEDINLISFLVDNEKDFKELKEHNNDKSSYLNMLLSINPMNLLESLNYMKKFVSIKCTQTLFNGKRNHVNYRKYTKYLIF